MQQTTAEKLEIKLVGVTVRTNNAAEFAKTNAKIGPLVQKYIQEALPNKIEHRLKPWTTYSVFTDYESNHMGNYTYFIGEEVTSFDNLPEGFSSLIIPAQKYIKFTNGPAPMPSVCVDIWQEVWKNTDLESNRAYIADFEIYDERAMDRENTVLDIYIGIK
jgi:predicted transcriptional regulator YdeE